MRTIILDLEDLSTTNGRYDGLLCKKGAKAIAYKMQGTGKFADFWKPREDNGLWAMSFENREIEEYLPYIKKGYQISITIDVSNNSIVYKEKRIRA